MDGLDLREPLLPQVDSTLPIFIPCPFGQAEKGTIALSTSPVFGASEGSSFEHPGGTEVIFLNLTANTVFEKYQSRRGGEARMRVDGIIEMVCTSPVQIMGFKVYVFREPSAAKLCNDNNGRMELTVENGKMEGPDTFGSCQQYFSVDLNSIYDGPKKPAYELAKVETDLRNKFQLAVEVQYIGGVGFQEFVSIPFLLKTKKKNVKNKKRVRLQDSASELEDFPDSSRPRLGQSPADIESIHFSPDSLSNDSSEYRPHIDCHNLNVINHLKANHASINNLVFDNMQSPKNADLGYRFKLKTGYLQEYEEGDVVGFFKEKQDEEDGVYIELLDSNNAKEAFMGGVISRSTYLVANQRLDKDSSDVVDVIGVSHIKCAGSVQTGERLYSTLNEHHSGIAIAESHLPASAMYNNRGILLGVALEEKKAKHPGDVKLVKSFVCIVMGVTDKQITNEIQTMYDHVEMKLNEQRKRSRQGICITTLLVMFFILGLSVLTFELFYPGSALREAMCKAGSIEGHWARFQFMSVYEEYHVFGVEFSSYRKLQDKISPAMNHCPPLNTTVYNITKAYYYLNLYRCSHGATQLRSTLTVDSSKENIGGAQIFAVDDKCSKVFFYQDASQDCLGGWCPYKSASRIRCNPTRLKKKLFLSGHRKIWQ